MKNLLKAVLLVLDEVLLVFLVFIILEAIGVQISLPIKITVIVLMAIVILVVYRIIVSFKRRGQVGAREGMIGLHGKVVRPLTPEGVIKVHGEVWKASCTGDSIGTQEDVVVVGVEGLTLIVKRKNDV